MFHGFHFRSLNRNLAIEEFVVLTNRRCRRTKFEWGLLLLALLLVVMPVGAARAARTTGFIPGEWQITTTSQSALTGSQTSTAEICLRGLEQSSTIPGDSAQITVPGEAGAVHNIITQDPGTTILQSRFRVRNTLPGSGPVMVESYTGREVYRHDPLHHSVMSGTGTLTYTRHGKVVMQDMISQHGHWLASACLAHPPQPVSQAFSPSPALQRQLATAQKAEQDVQNQSAGLGSAQAKSQSLQAEQKLMAPLEQESRQALKDHDMPKFLQLQMQIRALEKTSLKP
jgi:hypothetical protein